MLFRTVYGPELEALYNYIISFNISFGDDYLPRKKEIYEAFLPDYQKPSSLSTQSIDDAISFLISSNLIKDTDLGFEVILNEFSELPFSLKLLGQLRLIETTWIEKDEKVNSLFFYLFDELFIKADRLFIANLHLEANKLSRVKEIGGLSFEKIQAWKRVMSFLGIGGRIFNGFQCYINPNLLFLIFKNWDEPNDVLQTFLEQQFNKFIPFLSANGELAKAISVPLQYLEKNEKIRLSSKVDLPYKTYFGDARIGFITSY